jgi:protein-S-isoprenylcysteine O-methyltransferase Ste14
VPIAVPSSARRAFAAGGALAFGLSVAYVGWAYLTRFDRVPGPWNLEAATIDAGLFTLFALHHSLLARTGLKRLLMTALPADCVRPLYVWVASLLLALVVFAWQPIAGEAWQAAPPLSWLLLAVQAGGVLLLLAAGRRFDLFDFAGLRGTVVAERPADAAPVEAGPYRFVRHPLYLGIVLLLWPVPNMGGDRLLFAALNTAYLVVAIPFEERDLRRAFGAAYDAYASRVRWRVLPGIY